MRRGAVVEDVSVQIEESFRSNFPRLRVSTGPKKNVDMPESLR
ncbi:hypothetical protein PROFUN_10272, partial [Planoprotostelium fungivorum]